MSYSVDKFSEFDEDHQLRWLYKQARSQNAFDLQEFVDVAKAPLVYEPSGPGVDAFLAQLEKLLSISVEDRDFVEEQVDGDREVSLAPVRVILHNMRSAFNVGSILRSAECFGFQKVFLTGYTPNPDQPQVKKTAMGTDEKVQWQSCSLEDALYECQGNELIALELSSKSENIEEVSYEGPITLVLGNERFGVDE